MDSTALRVLNQKLSPLFCSHSRCPTRPTLLTLLRRTQPSPPPRPRRPPLHLSPPPPPPPPPRTSLSCSVERIEANFRSSDIAGATSEVSHEQLLQVVLVSPQIAGNTGCIARTCAASAVGLHLIEPLGYKIDDSKLKRAGLDYWPYVVVKVHGSWSEFRDYFTQQKGEKRLLAFTKRGTSIHSDFSYKPGDWLVFGSETSGLPPDALLDCNKEGIGGGTLRIPMIDTYVRCLNLSVSVGIALYEASRQLNYEQLRFPPDVGTQNQSLFISEDIFA